MHPVTYLLQVSLYLALFFGLYAVVFRQETFYQLNRLYLVASAVVALLLPFWHSAWVQSWLVTQEVSQQLAVYQLDALAITAQPDAPQPFSLSLKQLLAGVYFAGIIFATARLAYRLWQTRRYFQKQHTSAQAFSFFSAIKVDEQLPDYDTIYAHEAVHARQLHSADVMLFQLLGIVLWFHPVVYLYQRAVETLHELIADQEAAKTLPSKADYAVLLVSQQLGTTPQVLLSHSFSKSITLKHRIQMLMKKPSQKMAVLKYGLIAPLFGGMLITASAAIAKAKPFEKIEEAVATEVAVTPDLQIVANDSKLDMSQTIDTESTGDTIKPSLASNIVSVDVKLEKLESKLDEPPTFPGGTTALYTFLANNIKYPKEAIDNNKEGRVFIRFVVEKDGSLSQFKILKGAGYGMDEEAVRVASTMPKWIPGKQQGQSVEVPFTLPISFDLGHKKSATSNPSTIDDRKFAEGITFLKVEKNDNDKDTNTDMIGAMESMMKGMPNTKNSSAFALHESDYPIYIDGKSVDEVTKSTGKSRKEVVETMLRPQNIKSISVMKGEAAVKLHGESARNGVIEITLKNK